MSVANIHNKLSLDFYLQRTEIVAQQLLGKIFVKKTNGEYLSAKIVETEAYLTNDEASHSFKGETIRNKSMFSIGGTLYVYQIYGVHFCCNVVTNERNKGEAVLLRAVEPLEGKDLMYKNRFPNSESTNKSLSNLTNGPAKLCSSFSITKNDDGINLLGDEIFIVDAPKINNSEIVKTTRIGIKKSAEKLLRFYIKGNKFISKI